MELIAAGEVAQFEITVDGTSNSELAVAVKGEIMNTKINRKKGNENERMDCCALMQVRRRIYRWKSQVVRATLLQQSSRPAK